MEENKMYKYGIYIFSLVLVIVVLSLYFSKESSYIEPDYLYLEEGWDVSGSIEAKNINPTEFVFNQVKRGQEIYFDSTLPEYNFKSPALGMYTIHSAVRVTVDDEVIFDYGFDRASHPNRLVGYGYQLISLPENSQGKHIQIYLKVTESNAFTNFEAPWICNGTEFVKDFVILRQVPFLIIIFIQVMGVVIVLVSIRYGFSIKDFNKLGCIGAFSVAIGTWSICNYDIIFVFSYNPLIKTYTEFISLYICPIPLILYFWDDIHEKTKDWISIWYYILLSCQLAFTTIALILQLTEKVSLPRLLIFQHGLLMLLAFFLLATCIVDFMTKTYKHIALAIGILILFAVGVLDIIRFNIQKYIVAFQGKHYTSLICVGTFIFISCQLIDYIKGLQRDLIALAQTQTLEKWAFVDELTGLYNRRKSEQELDDIEEKMEPCGIFSFDLNNLKTINDTYGHEKGDEMIINFANVLREVFKEKEDAILARTGGDEFLAICRNPEEGLRKYFIERINALLANKSEEVGYQMEVAIGYAQIRDYENDDMKSTLRKADQRMYKNKSQMKSGTSPIR